MTNEGGFLRCEPWSPSTHGCEIPDNAHVRVAPRVVCRFQVLPRLPTRNSRPIPARSIAFCTAWTTNYDRLARCRSRRTTGGASRCRGPPPPPPPPPSPRCPGTRGSASGPSSAASTLPASTRWRLSRRTPTCRCRWRPASDVTKMGVVKRGLVLTRGD